MTDKKLSEPYPLTFSIKEIQDCIIRGDKWKHISITLVAKDGKRYRVYEQVLTRILIGECKILNVRFYRGRFYLFPLDKDFKKKLKLKKGEEFCKFCNAHGYIHDNERCPICDTKCKITWVEKVFAKGATNA